MTIKRTLGKSQFEDWCMHPVTRTLFKVIKDKHRQNSNDLVMSTNLGKGMEHVALRTAAVSGMQTVLHQFTNPEAIRMYVLDDDYISWED